jgi:hypothetical protein
MKKLILGTLVVALAGASLQTARANDTSWAVVGKVLTGVAVAGVVAGAIDHHGSCVVTYDYGAPCPSPVVYAPAPVVCAPPVVVAPAPVVVHRAPVVFYHVPIIVRHVVWRARW